MRIGFGIVAVAATTLIAAAMSGVHGGDYSAVAQADYQAWAQARQLSRTAEPSSPAVQLGQESPRSGAPAPPAGNAPPNPHSGTLAMVLDNQEVSAILGKSVGSNAGEDMGRIIDVIVSRDGQIRAAIIDFGGFSASARARSPSIGLRSISHPWASPARSRWSSPATRSGWHRNTSAACRWW
jgi:PRC-barrel domain